MPTSGLDMCVTEHDLKQLEKDPKEFLEAKKFMYVSSHFSFLGIIPRKYLFSRRRYCSRLRGTFSFLKKKSVFRKKSDRWLILCFEFHARKHGNRGRARQFERHTDVSFPPKHELLNQNLRQRPNRKKFEAAQPDGKPLSVNDPLFHHLMDNWQQVSPPLPSYSHR